MIRCGVEISMAPILRRLPRMLLAFCAACAILLTTARTRATPGGTPQHWHEDLKYLVRELAARHANAFHYASREQFEAAAAALDARLDGMDDDEIYAGMDSLASMIGDGHTYVKFPADVARFPILFGMFNGQQRVAAVGPGWEKALGSRLVKIEEVPLARVRELILPLTPQDETPDFAVARVSDYLSLGMVLHGVGITRDRNVAHFTLADLANKEFTLELHAVAAKETPLINWVMPFKERPLFRQNPTEIFWYQYLPDSRAVYCSFRGYKDLAGHAQGLFQLVQERKPDKLVIDLRQNLGGDYKEGLKHLVDPIRKLADINKKGRLFILIGTNTFSAAMANAAHFRYQTNAILVGRSIGEKPNSYQEPREFNLPNSHWTVRYSTQYYKFVESGENIIRPDQEIQGTWDDYTAGRDTALEWVLRYKAN
jgi:hypothetical protein